MERKYTTILFDADGTLIDFDKDEHDALILALKHYGHNLTEDEIKAYSEINLKLWKRFENGEIQKSDIENTRFKQFFAHLGIPLTVSSYEINKTYLSFLAQGGNLINGTIELLEKVKENGFDMHIVTNGIFEVQKKRLAKAKIRDYFGDMFVSEIIGHQKPKKEFFDFVLEHIEEKDKSKILLVGDSLTSDIKGAINFGTDSVWVNLKGAVCSDETKPTYEIKSLCELTSIIGI